MKKLLFITLLFLNGVAIAQNEISEKEKTNIKKGTWSFGGQLLFGSSGSEFENNEITQNSDSFRLSINPEIGYAVQKNLIIGLGLGYTYLENNNTNTNNNNAYSIYPYIKKFIPVNDKLLFSLRGEIRFSKTDFENSGNSFSNIDNNQSFFAGFRPGITYFVSKNLALEANIGALGYSRSNRESEFGNQIKVTTESFSFDFNSNNLLFGFTYYTN